MGKFFFTLSSGSWYCSGHPTCRSVVAFLRLATGKLSQVLCRPGSSPNVPAVSPVSVSLGCGCFCQLCLRPRVCCEKLHSLSHLRPYFKYSNGSLQRANGKHWGNVAYTCMCSNFPDNDFLVSALQYYPQIEGSAALHLGNCTRPVYIFISHQRRSDNLRSSNFFTIFYFQECVTALDVDAQKLMLPRCSLVYPRYSSQASRSGESCRKDRLRSGPSPKSGLDMVSTFCCCVQFLS